MTSVSAGHIILTPIQPVGSGRMDISAEILHGHLVSNLISIFGKFHRVVIPLFTERMHYRAIKLLCLNGNFGLDESRSSCLYFLTHFEHLILSWL